MKLEHGIIITCSILVVLILGLIVYDPSKITSSTQLESINDDATLAKEWEDETSLEYHRTLMQEKTKKIASVMLRINNLQVLLEDGYFPFKDSSQVKIFDDEKSFPICDIPSNIPTHFEIIKDSEMYGMFIKKYNKYPIELFIQDERSFESIVHYSFVATSPNGQEFASMWVHLDSCSNEISVPLNLSCRDTQGEFMHTRYKSEILQSIDSNEFCKIILEPWREELFEYTRTISDQIKLAHEHLVSLDENMTQEVMMDHIETMNRLELLSNIVQEAMEGDSDDTQINQLKQEYTEKFGDVPDDLLELIKR